IAASCPIQRTSEPTSSPSNRKRRVEPQNRGMVISVLLMMPSVTDWERAMGLPIASTYSPTWILEESPKLAGLNSIGCSDRKSTRLNSSHGNISYAVCCLKKTGRESSLRRPEVRCCGGGGGSDNARGL